LRALVNRTLRVAAPWRWRVASSAGALSEARQTRAEAARSQWSKRGRQPVKCTSTWTRRVRLVRGEGRGVSD
jgi:hypothetical protein